MREPKVIDSNSEQEILPFSNTPSAHIFRRTQLTTTRSSKPLLSEIITACCISLFNSASQ
jgi:hypothetical protein